LRQFIALLLPALHGCGIAFTSRLSSDSP